MGKGLLEDDGCDEAGLGLHEGPAVGAVERLHEVVQHDGLGDARGGQLLVVPLKVHALALALVVDGEERVDVVERDARRRRCGGRSDCSRLRGDSGLCRAHRLGDLRVHHGDDANLVAVARRLHGVLVRMCSQRKSQAALAEDVVVLVLIVRLGLGVAPLIKVPAVPDNRVAVRAVRALHGEEADREVLPDSLAHVDVGHHPARQHLSVGVVHAGDEDDVLLGLRRVGSQPHLRQVIPAELMAVHGGHDGVSHQVDDRKVLNCNGHLGRKGRKGRKAGRLEGRKEGRRLRHNDQQIKKSDNQFFPIFVLSHRNIKNYFFRPGGALGCVS